MQPIQIADLLDYVSFHAIQARRTFLSRLLFANFGGVVRYGPLKGFRLDEDPSWNPADLAPKLLGLYEQEVLNLIGGLRGRHRAIVNLGAGDGYYGIGLVSTGVFEQSICFELTESGQESLKRTAAKKAFSTRSRCSVRRGRTSRRRSATWD